MAFISQHVKSIISRCVETTLLISGPMESRPSSRAAGRMGWL